MIKRTILFLCLSILFCGSAMATSISPASCAALQTAIEADCSADYELAVDIDCTSEGGLTPICSSGYSGIFDGQDHVITGLTINQPSGVSVGLFGYITGGTLKNIGLEGVDIDGDTDVGALAGTVESGTIEDSYSTGDVDGLMNTGGLIGFLDSSTLDRSYSTADVTGDGTSLSLGGLVGTTYDVAISDCFATGDVTGVDQRGGGLSGDLFGTVDNCYAIGAVSGTVFIGGLIGINSDSSESFAGTITDSFATGPVTGSGSVGGVAGDNSIGTITNTHWYDNAGDSATDCYDGGNTGCTVQASTAYFQGASSGSAPMNGWDYGTPVWYEWTGPIDYPKLEPQDTGNGGETPIPEFSTIGMVLALLIVFLGTVYVVKKK